MDRLNSLENDLCIVTVHRFLALFLEVELFSVVLLLFLDLLHRQEKVMVFVGNVILYIVRCELLRIVVFRPC